MNSPVALTSLPLSPAALALIPAFGLNLLLLRSRRHFRLTTLLLPWNWLFLASLLLTLAALCDTLHQPASISLRSQLRYLVSILFLAPPVAVLGARRPGHTPWQFFVLAPLLLVLGWPAWADGFRLPPSASLQLQTPILLAHPLILFMGAGNYLGTKFRAAASLYILAAILHLLPFARQFESSPHIRHWLWSASTLIAFLSSTAAWLVARRNIPLLTPADRVWTDFYNSFGLIWGQRLHARLLETAGNQRWHIQLDPLTQTFRDLPDASTADLAASREKLHHALRWLLSRFVDPLWLEQRGLTSAAPQAQPPPGPNVAKSPHDHP